MSKIEDLFSNNHRMLIDLVKELLKKGVQKQSSLNVNDEENQFLHQAKGVWLRHSLEKFAPLQLIEEMNSIHYDINKDIQPPDRFAPWSDGDCL